MQKELKRGHAGFVGLMVHKCRRSLILISLIYECVLTNSWPGLRNLVASWLMGVAMRRHAHQTPLACEDQRSTDILGFTEFTRIKLRLIISLAR